jgi:ankyrin repeat protein
MMQQNDREKFYRRIVVGVAGLIILVGVCSLIAILWRAGRTTQYGSLQRAADAGNVDEVRRLLASGVNVDVRSESDWTALHVASDRGLVDVARVLLEHGASVKSRDKDGHTPLHLTGCEGSGRAQPKATEIGRNGVARLLLEHGADPNAADGFGNTPLHNAINSDDVDLVSLLLEHGADPERKNSEGSSPMDYASFMPQRVPGRIAKLLEAHRLTK